MKKEDLVDSCDKVFCGTTAMQVRASLRLPVWMGRNLDAIGCDRYGHVIPQPRVDSISDDRKLIVN